MVRICTGEVWVRSSSGAGRTFRQFQIKGVHIVAHRMKLRNIQRFEIVIRRFQSPDLPPLKNPMETKMSSIS